MQESYGQERHVSHVPFTYLLILLLFITSSKASRGTGKPTISSRAPDSGTASTPKMTCGRSNKKSSTSCSKKFSKGVLQIGRQCKMRRWTLPPLKAQAATCFLDQCRALVLNSIHLHISPDTHNIKDTTGHGKERGVTSKAALRPFYRSVTHYCTSHVMSQSSSLPHHPASPHCAITCVVIESQITSSWQVP